MLSGERLCGDFTRVSVQQRTEIKIVTSPLRDSFSSLGDDKYFNCKSAVDESKRV